VGISGASGAILQRAAVRGVRARGRIRKFPGPHQIRRENAVPENGKDASEVRQFADSGTPTRTSGAAWPAASCQIDAMVIARVPSTPCRPSPTASAGNPMVRAADVILKERRKLVFTGEGKARFTWVILKSMTLLAEMGASSPRQFPGSTHNPQTVMDCGPQRRSDARPHRLPDAGVRRWDGRNEMKRASPPSPSGERGGLQRGAARSCWAAGRGSAVSPVRGPFSCALKDGAASGGGGAIENTGRFGPRDYDHLVTTSFRSVAETSVRIVHNLIA